NRLARFAVDDLHSTGQDRFHLIDLSLLAGNDLTAKFLYFRILDWRPLNAMGSALPPPHKRPATTLTISLVFGVQLNLSIASATNETRAFPRGRPRKAHSSTRTRWIFGRLLERVTWAAPLLKKSPRWP